MKQGGKNHPKEAGVLWELINAILSLVKDGGIERSGDARLHRLLSWSRKKQSGSGITLESLRWLGRQKERASQHHTDPRCSHCVSPLTILKTCHSNQLSLSTPVFFSLTLSLAFHHTKDFC